jgi:hypothetical protein
LRAVIVAPSGVSLPHAEKLEHANWYQSPYVFSTLRSISSIGRPSAGTRAFSPSAAVMPLSIPASSASCSGRNTICRRTFGTMRAS